MTILFSNNASTTVAGSITPTSTTVNIAPGTGIEFPNPINPGDFFVATFYDQATKTVNEIVHVTHRAGDTCTIVRGQEGTTPQAWNSGDIFANLITAQTLASFLQSAAPAASTTDIYTGIDTSSNNTLIVANTTPVPASLQIGMLFVIKMLNTKFPPVTSAGPPPVLGPINMQLNGGTGIAVKRADGSDFIGGELVGTEEFIFIYNGTHFTSTIMNVPERPPQNIFYVNGTFGNDYNSGLSDNGTSTTQAFKTPQGAINRIKERYISSTQITIRVADATYIGGWSDNENYIASWNFVGNTANPQNCIIDATSTNPTDYQPGAEGGSCVASLGTAQMTVQGFTFKSYYWNLVTRDGGNILAIGNNYTGSTAGQGCIAASRGGHIGLSGVNKYTSSLSVNAVFTAQEAGVLNIGGHNVFATNSFSMAVSGGGACPGGVASASSGGVIAIDNSVVTFTGGLLTGPDFLAQTAGGVLFNGGSGILPGTSPGSAIAPGYTAG